MNVGLLTMVHTWGGCEVHVVQLARCLKERGHEATVVCLTELAYDLYRQRCADSIDLELRPTPKPPALMGFRDWHGFFSGQAWDPCMLIKGTFAVGDWKLDCAARLSFRHFLTIEQLIAPLVPRGSRRHLGFLPGLGLWWRQELLRGHLRSWWPQKVVCVSNAVRERLVTEYRFPERKLVTVWNGIDPGRFQPDRSLGQAWRREWGIPDRALVFGAVGRFAPMKGYPTALAGFQKVVVRFPDEDLRLVLVGQGEEEQALRALADGIVPPGKVAFVPFSPRPWEALSGIDVFLMPSLIEGLPQALLEAMACGCCAVASAAGGIPEVLSSPALGWLVPVGDTDAFAAAMIHAASLTPEERAIMGERARTHVKEHFNGEVQFHALVDVMENLTQPRRS